MLRGDPTESLNALTEQNMVFGTPEYMAPEQARGDRADERSDVYAVGVMLYEMLTGNVPFRSKTPIGMMSAHLTQTPEPPSRRAPHRRIAPALEAVVMHALAKAPDERYPSAAALAQALRKASCHPDDVTSTRPPPASEVTDLGTRDTEDAVRITALRLTEPGPQPPPRVPLDQGDGGSSRSWLLFGVIAILAGALAGVLASVLGAP
jgi:serine/threonine protein kinase